VWLSSDTTAARFRAGVSSIQLADLILEASVDPGSGKTRTFALMQNGAVPSPTPGGVVSFGVLSIADAESLTFDDGDVIGPLKHTPSGTPTVTGYEWWSMVMTATPPTPTGGGGVDDVVIDPDTPDIPTGILRVFLTIRVGTGSPYTDLAYAETTLCDDPSWYGGRKDARIIAISEITRELSTGVRGVEVRVVIAEDATRPLRTLATTETICGSLVQIYAVDDAVRLAGGVPLRLFAGKVTAYRAVSGFQSELIVRDVLSEELARLDDAPRIPPTKLTAAAFPGMTKEYEGRAVPIVIGECNDSNETGNITQAPQGVIPPMIVAEINLATTFGGVNRDVYACILSQCALPAFGVWEAFYNPIDAP
jgi:hypothetical protein